MSKAAQQYQTGSEFHVFVSDFDDLVSFLSTSSTDPEEPLKVLKSV